MTSPYSTPRYPRGPNPTPHSTQKGLRPPIHNPFDKFTQPEFDAWITDITGALKHALGREETPTLRKREPSHPEEDECVEDSFAEVKARRLAKGKERARDEDLEEEETTEENEEDQDEDGWGEAYSGEEYSGEETGESEEEAPRVGHSTEHEIIDLLSDDNDAQAEGYEGVEAEEDVAEEEAEAYGEDAEGSEASSDDDEASSRGSPAAGPSTVTQSAAHEVTEILDSEEEPEEIEERDEQRALPARFQRKPIMEVTGHLESDDEADYEEDLDEEQGEEEDVFPPRDKEGEPVNVEDPWRGPTTYAEDLYSGGDILSGVLDHGNPHTLPAEEDEGGEPAQSPELPDPWEGPRQFAEDFYAGGDTLLDLADLTPSHLTPKDERPLIIPGITPVLEDAQGNACPASPEIHNVDDLHADVDRQNPREEVREDNAQGPDHESSDNERSSSPVSPPSTTLRNHVDWNWPPAFPGLVATRSGHVDVSEQEIFEISDDEEDELAASPAHAEELPAEPPALGVEADPIADEVQQPTAIVTDDTSGLYGEFDELYDMGPSDATFNLQETFEPISPPGLDFGELPAFAQGFSAADPDVNIRELDTAEAPPSLESVVALVQAAADAPVNATELEPSELIADNAPLDDEPLADSAEPQRLSVSLEEFTNKDELESPNHSIFQAGDSYPMVVIEFDDEGEDTRSVAPLEDDIDISSVCGDTEVSAIEYVVEEVQTEGRRTEEPELAIWEQYEGSSRSLPSELLESKDPTAFERHTKSPAANGPLELSVNPEEVESESKLEVPYAPSWPHDAPAPITTAAPLERTHSSLSSVTDFPPPISANPDVPDPASLSHTPPSPASPVQTHSEPTSPTRETHDANAFPANAALHPLFRKLATQAAHSPSGLFTPLTDSAPASVTPEDQSSPKLASIDIERDVLLLVDEGDILETEDADLTLPVPVEATEEITLPAKEAVEPTQEIAEVAEEVVELTEELAGPADEVIEPVEDKAEVTEVTGPSEAVSHTAVKNSIPAQEQAPSDGEAPDEILELCTVGSPKLAVQEEHPEDVVNDIVAVDFGADPRDVTPATDVDADAEGEVDPEYTSEAEDSAAAASAEVKSPVADEVSHDTIEETAGEPEPVISISVEQNTKEAVGTAPPLLSESELTAEHPVELKSIVEEQNVAEDDVAPADPLAMAEVEDEVRPLKRKRGSAAPPATRIPRLTRSKTSQAVQRAFMDHVSQRMAKSKGVKGKGKSKVTAESEEEDKVSIAQSNSSESMSGGSSTAAQQILLPNSRGSSRASSVASNAPSAYSGLSQPSPTIDRILPNNGHSGPPPPFIHSHGGILHHHHGRAMAPVVPVVQSRQPSSSPVPTNEVTTQRASVEPGPSSQPSPVKAAPTMAISSPVTRSNCRFHTISVPKEEDGLRIHFAVPGCSLGGNAEFMKDEKIEDDGYVKADDLVGLIRDVESLNLSPYIVGVLRQLVGVDLLREQEVFYIPRPGDRVIPQSKRKSHRAKLKQRESISARTLSSGSLSRKGSSMAPLSHASVSTSGESVSTAGRLSQRWSVTTSGSFSGSDLSDLEDDGAPPPKRTRAERSRPEPSRVAEQPAEAAEAGADPPAADPAPAGDDFATAMPKSRKPQPRRSRRLGPDASAYKPDGGESDGSDEGLDDDGKKKRKRTKRSLKRTRTEETGDAHVDSPSDKPKRRRVRTSTSTNGRKAVPQAGEAACAS
ncbi:hypothetical protein BC628DRAFT_1366012 [Trametes gibbosa]|nr:hypothetical protein BC628DRAFT_1366012 [Trametes gibbosa]